MSRKPKSINPDEVDPSVYYYDEIYDEMKDEESKVSKNDGKANQAPQASKYIQGLIETADQRRTEKELRKFKRFAKDREDAEADGELDDVDVYITPTYEKKLEEMKRISEAKRRRLEQEKDNAMNFSRRHPDDSIETPQNHTRSSGKQSDEPHQDTFKETKSDTKQHDEQIISDAGPANKSIEEDRIEIRRELKTIEDRKDYLRQVLAKRTVGAAYEAAVQRFKQRKANKMIF